MNSRFTTVLVALVAVATINYARGEGATDLKQVGVLNAHQVYADQINGGAIVMPFSTKALGTTFAVTNSAKSIVTTELNSHGVYVVSTNAVAASATTNANTIGPRHFYGKAGVYLTAPTTGYTTSLAAPGTTVETFIPAHNNITTELGSNGVYVVTTNAVSAATVLVPAATIGQILNLVAATNCTFAALTTTVLDAAHTNTITMLPGSVLTVTPISGSQWKVLAFNQ